MPNRISSPDKYEDYRTRYEELEKKWDYYSVTIVRGGFSDQQNERISTHHCGRI